MSGLPINGYSPRRPKLNGNFAKIVLPVLSLVGFGIITYFVFDYYGVNIGWQKKLAIVVCMGIVGFCIGKLLLGSDENDGGNGGDYFDYTGGSGGVL